MLVPSIDLMKGKAVQLVQGRKKVLERKNVLALAREFNKYGEIAVIDLDAALGRGNNEAIIKKLCSIADCRVGGGIRTAAKARRMLKAGAKKIIIGTAATPEFLKQLPKDKVIVALDFKGNKVYDQGWRNNTNALIFKKIKELENYCSGFLCTNIEKEGMMQGIDLEIYRKLKRLTQNNLTAAGGITTASDIKALEDINIDSQIGMALYTNKISLPETFISLLNFKYDYKKQKLIATIVQDENKNILMFGYSSRDSLLKAFKSSKAAYFSRTRNKLWTKGETSGNFQDLIKARYDCDRDTLLFTVKQKNAACHLGRYSCFGRENFTLEKLYEIIRERMEKKVKGSYTASLTVGKIKNKIREESDELISYKNRANLVWEAADVLYFLLALMAKKSIKLKEVMNELEGRRK